MEVGRARKISMLKAVNSLNVVVAAIQPYFFFSPACDFASKNSSQSEGYLVVRDELYAREGTPGEKAYGDTRYFP
jgi:hypothetical protein